MNDDSLVSSDVDTAWQEPTAVQVDSLIASMAEVARHLRVMISMTVSPYDAEPDDQ